MSIEKKYLIGGVVQGVGFRLFTKEVASREGINGCVRNLDNGCVEVLAEGSADAIERLEEALNKGPEQSRVVFVKIKEMKASEKRVGFKIER
jgi:acylphosphatase